MCGSTAHGSKPRRRDLRDHDHDDDDDDEVEVLK
jgi:hypothetical protein